MGGGEPAPDSEPTKAALGTEAARVLAAAAGVVSAFGAPTFAKGLELQRRKLGRRVPGHLARDARAADAAGTLLRHPGAAGYILEQLAAWLALPGGNNHWHSSGRATGSREVGKSTPAPCSGPRDQTGRQSLGRLLAP